MGVGAARSQRAPRERSVQLGRPVTAAIAASGSPARSSMPCCLGTFSSVSTTPVLSTAATRKQASLSQASSPVLATSRSAVRHVRTAFLQVRLRRRPAPTSAPRLDLSPSRIPEHVRLHWRWVWLDGGDVRP